MQCAVKQGCVSCAMLWSALTYISEAISRSTVMVDETCKLKAAEEHSCKQFATVHACYVSSTVACKSILDTLQDMWQYTWSLQYVLWATWTICRACMQFAGTRAPITVTLIVAFDGRRQHISGLQLVFHAMTYCCTCILFVTMHAYSNFPVWQSMPARHDNSQSNYQSSTSTSTVPIW